VPPAPGRGAAPASASRPIEPPPPIPFPGIGPGPLRELQPENVEAIEGHADDAAPDATTPVTPPESAPAAGSAAGPGPARPRALVAEDSITARVFLMRLLEQQGFDVETVARAADLHAALPKGPWTVVFVDVELPDAHGAALLDHLRGRLGGTTRLVALVRDLADEGVARAAGVAASLRKPFERDSLERLLTRLSLGSGSGPAEPRA
jgi:CheY-like chemotaxis protein